MSIKKIAAFATLLGMVASSYFAVSFSSSVTAQNNNAELGNGFKISPVRYETTINKGESQTVDLYVENPTKANIEASVIINDFSAPEDESGEPKIYYDANTSAPGNSFKSIASAPSSLNIPADQRAILKVRLDVSKNASAGGYYGTVRVVPKELGNKNINLSASVGTLFLVKVNGEITEQLVLKGMTAAKNGSNGRIFIGSGAMSIVTRLENTGNIHVKPFGKVQILKDGEVIEEYEFNNKEPRANVLPKSIRKFDDKLKNQKWQGKYTVKANLGYGTTGSLISKQFSFWVIPVWWLVVFIVVLVLLLIGGFMIYRKYNSTRKHKIKARRK